MYYKLGAFFLASAALFAILDSPSSDVCAAVALSAHQIFPPMNLPPTKAAADLDALSGGRPIAPAEAALLIPSAEQIWVLRSAALVATFSAIFAFFGVFMLRGGVGDSAASVSLILAFAILPIWVSTWALSRYSSGPLEAGVALSISIFVGVLLPLSGLLGGILAGIFGVILLAVMLGVAGSSLWRSACIVEWKGALSVLILAIMLIIFTMPQSLFHPETITLGLAHTDYYYHFAIAQMIAHYGIPSIGADGPVLHQYHFLAHAVGAGLAKAAGADIPVTFVYWGQLTLRLQLIWSVFCAGILLFRADDRRIAASTAARFVYACLVGVMLLPDAESFALSLILLSAFLPVVIGLMKAARWEKYVPAATLVACAAAFFLTAAKTSTGFFCAIALVLVAWNLRGRLIFVALIAVTLAAVALFAKGFVIPRDIGMLAAPFFTIATSYVNYLTWTTFFSYAAPIFIIFLLALQPRLRIEDRSLLLYFETIRGATTSAATGPSWLDGTSRIFRALRWFLRSDCVVQLLILSISGSIFVLLTTPIGVVNYYFSAVLFAIALLLLPTALCETLQIRVTDKAIAPLLALALFANMLSAAWAFPVGLLGEVAKLYRTADPGGNHLHIKDEVLASIAVTGKPFSVLHQLILASPWTQLTRTLEIEAHSVSRGMAVNIAPSADEVWRRLDRGSPWWCMAPHLMIPAETGIFEIRSVAPKAIEQECAPPGITWYGFGKDQDNHRAIELSDSELCTLARPLNVSAVYRLQSYKDLSKNSIVKCDLGP
jgi:hypothetical protein